MEASAFHPELRDLGEIDLWTPIAQLVASGQTRVLRSIGVDRRTERLRGTVGGIPSAPQLVHAIVDITGAAVTRSRKRKADAALQKAKFIFASKRLQTQSCYNEVMADMLDASFDDGSALRARARQVS